MKKTEEKIPQKVSDQQRRALLAFERLRRTGKNVKALPNVSPQVLRTFQMIAVDADGGGNGITASYIADQCNCSTSSVSYAINALAGALAVHAPEAGIRLVDRPLPTDGNTTRRLTIEFLDVCQVCAGKGTVK